MTREEQFVEKWINWISSKTLQKEMRPEMKADLDALLKEVAEKAWNDCEEDTAKHYLSGKDCLYRTFNEWYDTFINQP
ncbi:MAG TPA: hypothetical protein ENH82_08240 [bacterium]|nr:hypothetical protein [bacterium]